MHDKYPPDLDICQLDYPEGAPVLKLRDILEVHCLVLAGKALTFCLGEQSLSSVIEQWPILSHIRNLQVIIEVDPADRFDMDNSQLIHDLQALSECRLDQLSIHCIHLDKSNPTYDESMESYYRRIVMPFHVLAAQNLNIYGILPPRFEDELTLYVLHGSILSLPQAMSLFFQLVSGIKGRLEQCEACRRKHRTPSHRLQLAGVTVNLPKFANDYDLDQFYKTLKAGNETCIKMIEAAKLCRCRRHVIADGMVWYKDKIAKDCTIRAQAIYNQCIKGIFHEDTQE